MKAFFIFLCSLIGLANSLGPYPNTSPHSVKPRIATSGIVPTNSWYQNWLLGNGENPVHAYPYLVKADKSGFTVCYANIINQKTFAFEAFLANIVVSVRELSASTAPFIDQATVQGDFFDLGAKMKFGSAFDATITRGYASVIFKFYSTTPVIKSIHAILNGAGTTTTRELKITMNNGQTWLIQSQSAIAWSLSTSEISAPSTYTGWVKISIVTGTENENALKANIDAVITNGKVSYSVDRSATPATVTVNLNYNTQGLFYILPHAKNTSGATLFSTAASAKGIKGSYRLASGNGYSYKVPVYSSTDPQQAINTQEKKDKLTAALKKDVNLKIESKDPYFGGKELARTARLIEIADLVNDAASKQKAKDVLVNELDSFWFGISSGTTGLVYEPTWGGIVSRGSVGSAEADFGQYYYNDHHFHYGYFVNAFATLAKHYPAYYNSRLQYINPILDDFAGTCLNSALPCRPRNKDPFLGHSYAAGIFEFADSRNQESTSEAVNSYFAVRELGKALQNSSLEDLGDYLLSTELVATQTYWQIKSPSDIYASPFADNGVVGILWETKVDYATFFGANVEFIYGIQMLPFNEMTPAYLDQDWLRATKTVWGKGLQSPAIEEGWKGFLLLADALIDPAQNGLSLKIHSLTAYDNGNTETNTLYFYYMVGGTTDTTVVQTTTKPTSGSSSTTGFLLAAIMLQIAAATLVEIFACDHMCLA